MATMVLQVDRNNIDSIRDASPQRYDLILNTCVSYRGVSEKNVLRVFQTLDLPYALFGA